jgi:hypothetical protein
VFVSAANATEIMLLWYNGSLYEQNSFCAVAVWTTDHFSATTLPANAPDPVAAQCPVATIPGSSVIYDNAGNSWTLTSGNQVAENGATFANTTNIILLMYYDGVIYQQNNLCGVWQYGGGGVWNQTSLPIGALYQVPQSVLALCPATAGIWSASPIQPTYAGTNGHGNALMLSDAGGDLYFETVYPECTIVGVGEIAVTPPTGLNAGNSYAVSGSALLTGTGPDCTGGPTYTDFGGTFSPGQSLNITLTDFNNVTTSYYWEMQDFSINPQQAVFYQTSTLAQLQGNWLLPDGRVWQIDNEGNIIQSDVATPSCTDTGTISLIDQPFAGAAFGAYNQYSFYFSDRNCFGSPYDVPTETGLMAIDGGQLVIASGQEFGSGSSSAYSGAVQNEFLIATKQ